jgi:putative transposase
MWPGRVPRVQGFFYRGNQRYFITLTTHRRARSFATPSHANALAAQIAPFFAVRCFEVLAYCVMPDHVHLLLEGLSDAADLREAIRAWKPRTGYDWKQRTAEYLWQPGFHDRVMREGEDTRLVVRYILHNPVRAGLVTNARDYPWSGSSRYTIAELQEHAGEWSPEWKRRV